MPYYKVNLRDRSVRVCLCFVCVFLAKELASRKRLNPVRLVMARFMCNRRGVWIGYSGGRKKSERVRMPYRAKVDRVWVPRRKVIGSERLYVQTQLEWSKPMQ